MLSGIEVQPIKTQGPLSRPPQNPPNPSHQTGLNRQIYESHPLFSVDRQGGAETLMPRSRRDASKIHEASLRAFWGCFALIGIGCVSWRMKSTSISSEETGRNSFSPSSTTFNYRSSNTARENGAPPPTASSAATVAMSPSPTASPGAWIATVFVPATVTATSYVPAGTFR